MITAQIIQDNIGKYIRFGGFGIIDGLREQKNKASFYRIIELKEGGLILRRFCARFNCTLPDCNWNQDFEIIDQKEYKTLPKY